MKTVERVCQTCGHVFHVAKHRVNQGGAICCSHRCAGASREPVNEIRVEGNRAYMRLEDENGELVAWAVFDAADLTRVKRFGQRWRALWNQKAGRYRVGTMVGRRWVSFSRWLLNPPADKYVACLNGNTLDCRRENLSVVDRSGAGQNRKGANRNSTSGIRNVSWDPTHGKWRAAIRVRGKQIFLGRHEDLADAEAAVIAGRRRYMPHSPH